MTDIAVCLLKDHPDLKEIEDQLTRLHEQHDAEIEELAKLAKEKSKFADRSVKALKEKLETKLIEKDLMPADYDRHNKDHYVDVTDSGVVVVHICTSKCRHNAASIEDFLRGIFTK